MASSLSSSLTGQQGAPSFGQRPSLGGQLPSSLGGQSLSSSQPLSGVGQPSPLLSQLSQRSGGQVLMGSGTGQQQSSGVSLLGGSGVPGSGQAQPSYPFSANSLASTAVGGVSSPLGPANKPSSQLPVAPLSSSSSPQQQQQQQQQQQLLLQQQQQKKQSPLSHPQSSLPLSQPSVQPPPAAVSGTTIGGLRFAQGYLSNAQRSAPPPPPATIAPPFGGQQLTSGPGVGLTRTIGLTSSAASPASLVSQQPPSVSEGVLRPSMPPSQAAQPPLQQLPVKPLHSSTPLAHPAGLHPPPPRPLPPHLLSAANTAVPPVMPNSAATVQPSPLLGGTAPLSMRMAAPKPVGHTQGGGGGPSVATATGQPRPVAPSTAVYQSPQMVGVRPSVPLVQKQPPPGYGYGAPPPPPTSVGGASVSPRTAHRAPPPCSNAADDTEVQYSFRVACLNGSIYAHCV